VLRSSRRGGGCAGPRPAASRARTPAARPPPAATGRSPSKPNPSSPAGLEMLAQHLSRPAAARNRPRLRNVTAALELLAQRLVERIATRAAHVGQQHLRRPPPGELVRQPAASGHSCTRSCPSTARARDPRLLIRHDRGQHVRPPRSSRPSSVSVPGVTTRTIARWTTPLAWLASSVCSLIATL
jgi:hypothetical protein